MIILFFFIWACLASFGKVIVDNEDDQKHILTGRSKCDNCKHELAALDLIPVFWWIINKWCCKYCGQKISIIYILLELICGFGFAGLYYYFWFENWSIYIFTRSVVMICYSDIKNQTINLVFLGILGIVWLTWIYDIWLVQTCTLGIFVVYILWFVINKIKYKTWDEWMWIGDILLTICLRLNFLNLRQIINFNPQILLNLTDNLWSQTIFFIYIFLIWIVISSIYWLLLAIIYIYVIDKGKNDDDLPRAVPFAPALILGFITMLFL